MNGRLNFTATDNKVVKSWARGVQWDLTRMSYPNYYVNQNWPNYTLVVQDMLDNDIYFGDVSATGDAVNGYNIRQIEDALEGKKHGFYGVKV